MIETPTENVKLTFEQLQQIDVTQKRLAQLESEITIATKTLRGTKLEADRATKENAYQQELLMKISTQVDAKKKELEELNSVYTQTKSELSNLQSNIADKTVTQAAKDTELKNREDKLASGELALSKAKAKLEDDQNVHEQNVSVVNAKVEAIKQAISTF